MPDAPEPAQSTVPGRDARRIADALTSLRALHALPRLWEQDATLWPDPGASASRLGWLAIPRVMAAHTARLRPLAATWRARGVRRLLLVGMGGSSLFPEVCRRLFGVAAGQLDVEVVDTVDPTEIRAAEARGPLSELGLIVSSKSGLTLETTALARHYFHRLTTASSAPGDRCLVITDEGTPLQRLASTWYCRDIFTHGPGTGLEVGGRYSALTYFGLVPAALLGVDVDRLLARAVAMLAACGPQESLEAHPAVQLAAFVAAAQRARAAKLTLLFPPSLAPVGAWIEQLLAESCGKRGRGIIPVVGEPLREPRTYGSDRRFVIFHLASEPDAALARHARMLIEGGHPVMHIHWKDRYDLGGEVVKWAIASALAGVLLEVNPFDEPNVQESKDRTAVLLEQYARLQQMPEEPATVDGDVAVRGTVPPPPAETATLIGWLRAWLASRRPEDYIALLSFLPRTDALDAAMGRLREQLTQRLSAPVLFQVGPRYLHSTGQLFKGGPNCGLFLLVTAEESVDLPVPEAPYTFGVLKQAQALGDAQAMRDHGRRLLCVHLRGAPARALQRLADACDAALAGAPRAKARRA